MNAVNRLFVTLTSLAWIALMAGIVYLVWNPGEFIEVNGSTLTSRFQILLDTTSEQTLASIVLGLLMLPAVMLLFMEATVRDSRVREVGAEAKLEHDRNKQLTSRVNELENDLETERKRDADTVRRVADRDETYVDNSRVAPTHKWHLFGR